MQTLVKRGRKAICHVTASGVPIPHLKRKPDGRWRVTVAGKYVEFREADERLAVARARQLLAGASEPAVRVTMPVEPTSASTAMLTAMSRFVGALVSTSNTPVPAITSNRSGVSLSQDVDSELLWSWLRVQLLERPEWVGERVGVPQLAGLRDFNLPVDSIRLPVLISTYEQHARTTPQTKQKVRVAWAEMVEMTGARTLQCLTTERLLGYSDALTAKGYGPEYIANKMTRVKTVIGFGKKEASTRLNSRRPSTVVPFSCRPPARRTRTRTRSRARISPPC